MTGMLFCLLFKPTFQTQKLVHDIALIVNIIVLFTLSRYVLVITLYLTTRPVARKGYGSIAHEAKPNGLLSRGP